MARDGEFLARFLADDFQYINSQAKVLDKKDYIEMVKSGRAVWLNQELKIERSVQRGELAFVTTVVTDQMRTGEQKFRARFRQLLILAQKGEEWIWLAGQSTQFP